LLDHPTSWLLIEPYLRDLPDESMGIGRKATTPDCGPLRIQQGSQCGRVIEIQRASTNSTSMCRQKGVRKPSAPGTPHNLGQISAQKFGDCRQRQIAYRLVATDTLQVEEMP
jgi:hypothetical protein